MLSLRREQSAFMVLTDVATADRAEFNRWYDREHIPCLLQVPGFLAAQRFERLPAPTAETAAALGVPPLQMGFLAFYILAVPEVLDSGAFDLAKNSNLPGGNPEFTLQMRGAIQKVIKRVYGLAEQVPETPAGGAGAGAGGGEARPGGLLILVGMGDGAAATKSGRDLRQAGAAPGCVHLSARPYQLPDVSIGGRKEPGPDHVLVLPVPGLAAEPLAAQLAALAEVRQHATWAGVYRRL